MDKPDKFRVRAIVTTFIAVMMVLLSQCLNDKEIIFPEIMALAIGALLSPKQKWKVSKIKMLILIALHSMAGIAIVNFIPVHMIIRILIGFAFSLVSLYFSRSTFAPLISATVLPIILETTSIVYPISAVAFTAVIIFCRYIFEKTGLIQRNTEIKEDYDFKNELIIGIQRFAFVSLLSVPAVIFGLKFMIAPPLIVAFVEATSVKSNILNRPVKIWGAVCICGLIGCFSRGFVSILLGLPLWVSSIFAVFGIIAVIYYSGLYFPPAGAIAILPMLIDSRMLMIYPFEVALGFGLMLTAAYYMRKEPAYRSIEVHHMEKRYKAA